MEQPFAVVGLEPGLSLVRHVLVAKLLREHCLLLTRTQDLHRHQYGQKKEKPVAACPDNQAQQHDRRKHVDRISYPRLDAGGDQETGLGSNAECSSKLESREDQAQESRCRNRKACNPIWRPWQMGRMCHE